jgi:Tfp pilus assembly protein PilO
MTLLKRIYAEKRVVLLPLGLALLANLLAYALVVRPLATRSAGAADRAALAATARQAAEREEAAARALVSGKAQADEELNAFYRKVLPANLVAARRMTYASIPALATRTNVQYRRRQYAAEQVEEGEHLSRLNIRMELAGDYEDIRDFVFALESAPEFVILDEVSLSESGSENVLTLLVSLSTYFRTDGRVD